MAFSAPAEAAAADAADVSSEKRDTLMLRSMCTVCMISFFGAIELPKLAPGEAPDASQRLPIK
jgi:hypothetical protein